MQCFELVLASSKDFSIYISGRGHLTPQGVRLVLTIPGVSRLEPDFATLVSCFHLSAIQSCVISRKPDGGYACPPYPVSVRSSDTKSITIVSRQAFRLSPFQFFARFRPLQDFLCRKDKFHSPMPASIPEVLRILHVFISSTSASSRPANTGK